MLPRCEGLSVLQGVLREQAAPTLVLVLTALDSVADQVHGLDLGADDYLGQAVRLRGAPGARPRPPPPRDRAAQPAAAGRRSHAEPRHARGRPRRPPHHPDRPRVRPARAQLHAQRGGACSRARSSPSTSGASPSIPRATSSTCTSATCGARSTWTASRASSTRCGAWATPCGRGGVTVPRLSIRTLLTLWYAGLLLAVLVPVGAVSHSLLRRSVMQDLDRLPPDGGPGARGDRGVLGRREEGPWPGGSAPGAPGIGAGREALPVRRPARRARLPLDEALRAGAPALGRSPHQRPSRPAHLRDGHARPRRAGAGAHPARPPGRPAPADRAGGHPAATEPADAGPLRGRPSSS